MGKEKKIVAVGDFLKARDKIHYVAVPDPEDADGMFSIKLRIRKPSPNDTIKIMEFVNSNMAGKKEFIEKDVNVLDLEPEKRNEAISLAYQYDATLISSSVFFPPANDDLSIETSKVWNTADEVLEQCTTDLFNALKVIVGDQKMVVSQGVAKK